MQKILIVGGGSAGWMTAATLIKEVPNRDITLIESPNIATVGVGESTIGQIRQWTRYLGIKDKDFVPNTDASFKLGIRFQDFYKKGEHFHYPFGYPSTENLNDWYIKTMGYPDTPVTDYAESHYSIMALINENKILTDKQNEEVGLPNYSF